MAIGRDDRRAFRAVREAGELLIASVHAAAFQQQLGAVAEGIFDGIHVEVLIDAVAAIVPADGAARFDRPGVLHPAALVDVVDVEIAVATAAGPQERVETLYLIE